MKRLRPKREAQAIEIADQRRALAERIGLCEWCRKAPSIIHEIARGCDRSKALLAEYAILGLCHPTCHDEVGAWHRGKQLALLLIRRPECFDLQAYHTLISRNHPDFQEVLEHARQLRQEIQN